MKKRLITILLVSSGVILLLTGCGSNLVNHKQNSIYEDYYNKKVQYIGNNSEVVNLLDVLEVGALGEYTIVLNTDKETYGLDINYSKLKENGDEDKFRSIGQLDYAFYILALVDNLSYIDVNYKSYNYHLNIDKANSVVKGNIKEYGISPEKIKELNNILNPKD